MTALRRLGPDLLAALRERLAEDVLTTEPSAVERCARDETEDLRFPPDAVARPKSVEDVRTLLRFCNDHRVPVTPRGAGTGLSGGALPVHGGVSLSLERLDRIREIDTRDLTVEAETGVVTAELQRRVEDEGLFYPPDPGSRETCTLGGNLAEDAAGPRSCKYGSTRRWVLGLEAVLPDGELLRLGGRNRKDVAGLALEQLLVGSEGTLAVLTAVRLRLIPRPAARATILLPFPDLEAAAAAVGLLFRGHVDPTSCELLEEKALEAVSRLVDLPDALEGHRAVLVLELDGDDGDALLERAAEAGKIASEVGGGEPLLALDAADQRRLWAVRSRVGEAVKHGSVYKEADTVVPRSKLAELVRTARRVATAHGLEAVCYGHAGDGNLHVNLLRGELAPTEWERRRDAAERELFTAVADLGGSITGEHGVGWVQRPYLPLVRGEAERALMRRVKAAFDPHGILNPGKILED